MPQATITKYHGPSNVKGSRIRATAQAGYVTIEYDDGLSRRANHETAARKLAQKYGWLDDGSTLVGDETPDGKGYAFVILPPQER